MLEIHKLGKFNVNSDKLIVCDPCYLDHKDLLGLAVTIENVLPGTYVAEVTIFDGDETGGYGSRNADLIIRHEKYLAEEFEPIEVISDAVDIVAVDSGQVMFANKEYQDKYLTSNEKEQYAFYERCCDITLNTDLNAGIVENMPISESGFGDGQYDVFVARNDAGQVVTALVQFISESELEDDEDDMLDKELFLSLCDKYGVKLDKKSTKIKFEERGHMTPVQAIIEVFENFLEERDVIIDNPEKEGDNGAAIIYGTDYGELESSIEDVLQRALFRDRLSE